MQVCNTLCGHNVQYFLLVAVVCGGHTVTLFVVTKYSTSCLCETVVVCTWCGGA